VAHDGCTVIHPVLYAYSRFGIRSMSQIRFYVTASGLRFMRPLQPRSIHAIPYVYAESPLHFSIEFSLLLSPVPASPAASVGLGAFTSSLSLTYGFDSSKIPRPFMSRTCYFGRMRTVELDRYYGRQAVRNKKDIRWRNRGDGRATIAIIFLSSDAPTLHRRRSMFLMVPCCRSSSVARK
jgi:hypothetical protein